MKKTIIYIVLLGVLGYGVYYFLFAEHDVFNKDQAGFQVKDTADIGRIFLADRSNNTVTLNRKDNGWVLNNKYPAMQSPINTLLSTFVEQTPMYPVPASMHDNVIKILATSGIKVELYNKRGKKLQVFYVAGQANANEGTYMLMEGAKTPYVVQIPGFSGYITPRYSTDPDDWRDRTIFNVPQELLQSVMVSYPAEPLNNFTLKQADTSNVTVSVDPSISNGQQFNKRRAKVYTKFFDNINAEGYVNGIKGMDSIIRTTAKRCTFDVTDKKGNKNHVEVYWMPINRRSKNMLTPLPGAPIEYDADRFYATINNFKDTVIIQRSMFDKLFRKGYEFYQPDDTSRPKMLYEKGTGVIKMHGH